MQITTARHHRTMHISTVHRAAVQQAEPSVDLYQPSATPPTGLTRVPFKTQDTPELLERMRPYLRDVHVVSPPTGGAPPILGGRGIAPEQFSSLPSRRWVVTDRIEASHRERMGAADNQELRSADQELKGFVVPILQKRYGTAQEQVAIELGPADNTDLAGILGQGDNLFFGMDLSKPLLEKNRELVNEPGYYIPEAYQVQGDTYKMPFNDDVADVICVSCHPPFVSSTPADKMTALGEVHRVLKPGGEFVLFPWKDSRQEPEVEAFLHDKFEVVEEHVSHLASDRKLLVLKARL